MFRKSDSTETYKIMSGQKLKSRLYTANKIIPYTENYVKCFLYSFKCYYT